MAVKNPEKGDIIAEHARKDGDTGSTPVQIAILSQRIRHLTEHLRTYSKDHATRRGLLRLVGRRASLMRYYARTEPAAYQELVSKLGIRG
ncbi:MAG: 30S ribosomal protein S15 [Planctomycetota bacterium]